MLKFIDKKKESNPKENCIQLSYEKFLGALNER